MSKVTFETGQSVDFEGVPTPADIEEVAQKLNIQKPAVPRPGLFSVDTLKGETTYPAAEGGAETILPNIARTAGNIPSSAAKLARGIVSPINPFDTESPLNIGANVVKSAQAASDIYKQSGFMQGAKDVGSAAFDQYKSVGEFAQNNYDKEQLKATLGPQRDLAIKQRDDLMDKVYAAKKAGKDTAHLMAGVNAAIDSIHKIDEQIGTKEENAADNGSLGTAVLKAGIEDPLLIPSLMYGGPEAAGTKDDLIQRAGQVFTRGADTSLSNVANVVKEGVLNPLATGAKATEQSLANKALTGYGDNLQEFFTGTKRGTKLVNNEQIMGKDTADFLTRKITEADPSVRANYMPTVENETFNGKKAAETLKADASEIDAHLRDVIKSEGKVVNLNELRDQMLKDVNTDFRMKRNEVEAAQKIVNEQMDGYIKTYGENVPLENVQDIKQGLYSKGYADFDPSKGAVNLQKSTARDMARAAKTNIEVNVNDPIVKNMNKVAGDHYSAIDMLEARTGDKVKGGKLGRYSARAIGSGIGIAISHAGGPLAVTGSSLAGLMTGDKIAKYLIDTSIAGPIRKALIRRLATEKPDLLEQAILRVQKNKSNLLLPAGRPVENLGPTTFVTPKGSQSTILQDAAEAAARESGAIKQPQVGRVRRMSVDEPYTPSKELPVIQVGKKPVSRETGLPKASGAPKVFQPQRSLSPKISTTSRSQQPITKPTKPQNIFDNIKVKLNDANRPTSILSQSNKKGSELLTGKKATLTTGGGAVTLTKTEIPIDHATNDTIKFGETGAYFAPKGATDGGFGSKVESRFIKPGAKIAKVPGGSTYEFLNKKGLLDVPDARLKKEYGFNTLRDMWDNAGELADPNDAYLEVQRKAIPIIRKETDADVILLEGEDDLNPTQYVVQNMDVLSKEKAILKNPLKGNKK